MHLRRRISRALKALSLSSSGPEELRGEPGLREGAGKTVTSDLSSIPVLLDLYASSHL